MPRDGMKPAVTRRDTNTVSTLRGSKLVNKLVRKEWPTCTAAATEIHTNPTTVKNTWTKHIQITHGQDEMGA